MRPLIPALCGPPCRPLFLRHLAPYSCISSSYCSRISFQQEKKLLHPMRTAPRHPLGLFLRLLQQNLSDLLNHSVDALHAGIQQQLRLLDSTLELGTRGLILACVKQMWRVRV